MTRRSRGNEITLADVLQNASDDDLKANGLKRKGSAPMPLGAQDNAHRAQQSGKPRKARASSEHDEQVKLFKMAELYPALETMYAIPNGGYRTKATAGKLKAEGVKSGVPDICLPVRSRGYAGAYIEMKIPGNKPTENQVEWLNNLARNGYYCVVAYSADAALDRLLWYLGEK